MVAGIRNRQRTPKVSVVLPVYNGEATIKATVASVLDQTLEDFELIVVDDGSTDATLTIVSSIEDERVRVLSGPNAGVSASRNRGAVEASAAYISFLDADDLWTPDKLALQWQALQATPEAGVAYSWTDYIDENGRFVDRDSRTTASGNVLEDLAVHYFLESGSNALIRREAFEAVGGFDEALAGAADWDFFLRLAARYPFVAVPQPSVLRRLSGSSMSSDLASQEAECALALERAFQANPALRSVRKRSYANLYRYLGYKAVEGRLSRARAQEALRYFGRALRADPTAAVHQARITLKVLPKVVAALLLPPAVVQKLLDAWRRFAE